MRQRLSCGDSLLLWGQPCDGTQRDVFALAGEAGACKWALTVGEDVPSEGAGVALRLALTKGSFSAKAAAVVLAAHSNSAVSHLSAVEPPARKYVHMHLTQLGAQLREQHAGWEPHKGTPEFRALFAALALVASWPPWRE